MLPDGWQSCDPEKIHDLVSLVFLQCKPHANMGKARVLLCVYYGQCHNELAEAVALHCLVIINSSFS